MVKNVTQIWSGIMTNVGANAKIQKNITCAKTCYICSENGKYQGSIIDNSVITCDEVIDMTKIVPTTKLQQKLFQQFYLFD